MSDFWRRFRRNRGAVVGLVILALVIAMAAFASVLFPGSPWDMATAPFVPPGEEGMLLGSDSLGRDVAAGIAHGARISLMVGAVSTVAALFIGVTLGAAAGYLGGVADDAVMRFTEFFQTIPSFVFAILLVAIFTPTIGSVVFAIAVVSWPPVARVVRAEFLSLRSREFVQAAEVLGKSRMAIVVTDILPNALSPIVVLSSLMVASAILLESALSFLGLGVQPPTPSWGYMVATGIQFYQSWWMSFFPGLAIFLTVLALNFLGDAVRDAFDARLGDRND